MTEDGIEVTWGPPPRASVGQFVDSCFWGAPSPDAVGWHGSCTLIGRLSMDSGAVERRRGELCVEDAYRQAPRAACTRPGSHEARRPGQRRRRAREGEAGGGRDWVITARERGTPECFGVRGERGGGELEGAGAGGEGVAGG